MNTKKSMLKVKLTANILFSGIGCQERGFRNSELFDIEVLNTSDINKESVLSYAAIHCNMTNEMVADYSEYPPREEIAQYLSDINLGYIPEKDKHFDWFKLIKKKSNDLEKYWLACKLTNNRGDISQVEDLLLPCVVCVQHIMQNGLVVTQELYIQKLVFKEIIITKLLEIF